MEAVVADLLEAGTQTELPQHPDSEALQAGEKIIVHMFITCKSNIHIPPDELHEVDLGWLLLHDGEGCHPHLVDNRYNLSIYLSIYLSIFL